MRGGKIRKLCFFKVFRSEWSDLVNLRCDTFRQRPSIHADLVLHVLDLLLQRVLVHVGDYTGIHGYSRASLSPDKSRIALAPLRKINRSVSVWELLLMEHRTMYGSDRQQEIWFCWGSYKNHPRLFVNVYRPHKIRLINNIMFVTRDLKLHLHLKKNTADINLYLGRKRP